MHPATRQMDSGNRSEMDMELDASSCHLDRFRRAQLKPGGKGSVEESSASQHEL